MSKPGWLTYLRDVALFLIGVAIVLKQAGIYFEAPKGGPEIELIFLGALFCNGPLVLQFLALRFGAGGSPSAPAPSAPVQPQPPSSGQSSGGK